MSINLILRDLSPPVLHGQWSMKVIAEGRITVLSHLLYLSINAYLSVSLSLMWHFCVHCPGQDDLHNKYIPEIVIPLSYHSQSYSGKMFFLYLCFVYLLQFLGLSSLLVKCSVAFVKMCNHFLLMIILFSTVQLVNIYPWQFLLCFLQRVDDLVHKGLSSILCFPLILLVCILLSVLARHRTH